MTTTGSTALRRSSAVDVARALAVVGVVLNHAINGLQSAGMISNSSAVVAVNEVLYQFRMPALAFLLGLFVSRGVSKLGRGGYVAKRAVLGLYLYAVWYVIQMGTGLVMSRFTNTPVTWRDAMGFWIAPAHLWFLPYLALSALVLVLLRPWESRTRGIVMLVVLGLTTWFTWGFNPALVGGRGWSLFVFSGIGAWIGIRQMGRILEGRGWVAAAILGSSGLLLWLIAGRTRLTPSTLDLVNDLGGRSLTAPDRLASIASAAVGTVLVLALAAILSRLPAVRPALEYIGRRTLEIYLAHVIILAGVRVVLRPVVGDSWSIILPIAVLAGVLVPLALERAVRGTRLRLLFDPPEAWMPRPVTVPGPEVGR